LELAQEVQRTPSYDLLQSGQISMA